MQGTHYTCGLQGEKGLFLGVKSVKYGAGFEDKQKSCGIMHKLFHPHSLVVKSITYERYLRCS